ncbi:MAG: transglutaminase family protein [Bacteroidetes bacterium]|nr:transglutaminase family protein [Bacteroidota bacterium]
MPRFKIHHLTKYTYLSPVRDSANQILLYPFNDSYQEVVKHELNITGEPHVDVYHDYYGNEVGSFMNSQPHDELVIDLLTEVITHPHPEAKDDRPVAEQWAEIQNISTQYPYIDFLKPENFNAHQDLAASVESMGSVSCTPLQAAKKMSGFIFENFNYIKGITSVETTLDEVWKLKAGVCQDFAHVLLEMLKTIKIPARYVSGYICPNKTGLRGEGATHAWVEAYIPFYGWLGLDPTNNCIVDDLHVRLAIGRSFNDCSPVRGTYKGTSTHSLEVGVAVSYEDGRTSHEAPTVLTPQPQTPGVNVNSYRKYMEMIQQQQ